MNRENLAFLLAGLAFGSLLGFGVYHAVVTRPDFQAAGPVAGGPPAPRGPDAPAGDGGTRNSGGGAPMVVEINRLKQLLQVDSDNAEALGRLANLYHDAGMFEQAIGYYDRLIVLHPDNPDALTDLGICHRGMRQFARALELFAEAQRIQPTHWQSLFNAAVVAGFDMGRFDEAASAIESIEAIEPRPADLDLASLRQLREALEQSRLSAEAEGRS
jgi:tetratricopeptide (TPR) repeat protein